MSPEDKLAVEECLVLWKYLAQSGEGYKSKAIRKLNIRGKLSSFSYDCNCPLCNHFTCDECPWRTVPNNNKVMGPCWISGSPYDYWSMESDFNDRKTNQRNASAVYKFLKQINV